MTASIKTFAVAAIAGAFTVSPALADYTILEDSSFPSVMFVEFDSVEEVAVVTAPEPVDVMSDPALAPMDAKAKPPMMGDKEETASDEGMSVEERVNQRIAELEAGANQSADELIVDEELGADVLKEVDLRESQ